MSIAKAIDMLDEFNKNPKNLNVKEANKIIAELCKDVDNGKKIQYTNIITPTRVSNLLDKVMKKYKEKENEDKTMKKTSESFMLAYVLVEKCSESKNKSVNNYLRTDCMTRIGAYL